MCEPTTIAMVGLAISAVSVGAGMISDSQNAKALRKDEEHNADLQSMQLNAAREETNKQAVDEKSARALQSKIEQGRLRVTTGESGLAGNSNDKILEEGLFNEGFDIASIEANRVSKQKQLTMEGKGLRAASSRRLNSIKKPSLIGAGLQIAGSAVDSATTYSKLTASRAPIT